MTVNLTDKIFTDEAAAREHLEAIRWPNGPVCTHCGCTDKVYRLTGKSALIYLTKVQIFLDSP